MFEMRTASVIRTLVDLLVTRDPFKWTRVNDITIKPGIIIGLDCRVTDNDVKIPYGETIRAGADISFIFCGGVNTFAWHTEDRRQHDWEHYRDFENISNHDSCWISAVESYLNKIYFKLCHDVNPHKAPVLLDTSCSFSISGPKLVDVEFKAKPREEGVYSDRFEILAITGRKNLNE